MRASRSIAAMSLALALAGAPGVAPAQDKWPSKPIRMIVPFTAGAASDVFGRIVGQRLVTRINADTVSVLKEPATREKIVQQGAQPGFGPPEHFDKMQRDEYAELGLLITQIGMKPN